MSGLIKPLKLIGKTFSKYAFYDEDGRALWDSLYTAVENDKRFAAMVEGLMEAVKEDPNGVSTTLGEFAMGVFWGNLGFPVFEVTAELAASLMLTDCAGTMDDVKLPFACYYISVLGDSPVMYKGHPMRGIMAMDYIGDSHHNKGPEGRVLAASVSSADPNGVGAFVRWHVLPQQSAEEWTQQEDDCARSFTRLMINLAAYLQMKHERGEIPKAKKAKLGQKKGCSVTRLGADVKLPGAMIEAAKDFSLNGSVGTKWKNAKRFIVRGHFRNQNVGKRGSGKTKSIWIQPFWKGPDTVEATERTYRVEKHSVRQK